MFSIRTVVNWDQELLRSKRTKKVQQSIIKVDHITCSLYSKSSECIDRD